MTADTPEALLTRLVDLRSSGDVEAALACYEREATIVVQPGQVKAGADALRAVLEYFAASDATFAVLDRAFLQTDGVALHVSRWSLVGTDPTGAQLRAEGISTDVVHRQPDGTWLLAVDNPWGTDLLDAER